MISRRNFILQALIMGGGFLSNNSFASSINSKKNLDNSNLNANQELIDGLLCIPIYGPNRLPLEENKESVLAKINPITEEVIFEPTEIKNLHGLIESEYNNPNKIKIGIGHQSRELIQVYDNKFNNLSLKKFPNLNFRGHGIPYKEGILITAEQFPFKEETKNGILLYIDSEGNEIGRTTTGGSRPHEIIDCGDYFAIAHYGDRPSYQSNPITVDNCELYSIGDILDPGISFLNKKDLSLHSFCSLPLNGKITHLAVNEHNEVLAMGMNAYFSNEDNSLSSCAYKNNISLLNLELEQKIYEAYIPIYQVSADRGLIDSINFPIQKLRRGQSFSFDKELNIIIGTYAASQTLFVRIPDQEDKIINTLKFGISDPRGCVLIPKTGLAAISGNSDNIAIIDIKNEKLIKIIGTPLGQHSHLYWFN